ncbi:hypothetical protein [Bacillus litorisediminis]|uniref:hypothetical protein n=1 Tax=Bacillus litorisediminis TaxID=2922713 RepID=UPI001FABF569|nr:hypothetical protein [Bacillus litorisediminis]
MFSPLSNRERKIIFFVCFITLLIFAYISFFLIEFAESYSTFITIAIFLFLVQYSAFILPGMVDQLFLNNRTASKKTEELERKIIYLKEEIKRVNGEDYNDKIYNDF